MPVVIVPPPYQGPTRGVGRVELAAQTVRDAMESMEREYPGWRPQVFTPEGDLQGFVKIFCDGRAVSEEALDSAIDADAEIEVVAAIAGGSARF